MAAPATPIHTGATAGDPALNAVAASTSAPPRTVTRVTVTTRRTNA